MRVEVIENGERVMKEISALDSKGQQLQPGDIVEVTVKYRIVSIVGDGHVLAQKVYDVPTSILTKIS